MGHISIAAGLKKIKKISIHVQKFMEIGNNKPVEILCSYFKEFHI